MGLGRGADGPLWYVGVSLAIGGFAALLAGAGLAGVVAAHAGMLVLLDRALRRMGSGRQLVRATLAGVGSGLALVGTVALDLSAVPTALGILAAATGAQVLLLALGVRAVPGPLPPLRRGIVVLGHASVLLGFALAAQAPQGEDAVAGLAYMAGYAPLLLHALWARRQGVAAGPADQSWERVLLAALSLGLVGLAVNAALAGSAWGLPGAAEAARHAVRGLLLLGLAVLAGPPPLPAWLGGRGPRRDPVALHGAAAAVVVYAMLVAVLLAVPPARGIAFAALTSWLVIAVAFEYGALAAGLRRARRARRATRGPPPLPAPREMTVLVAALNEAAVLRESLEHNLALPLPLRFIVVVSGRSRDGTADVAREVAARHPGRVHVLQGPGDSKAEDLNAGWLHVTTPEVLVLDADETIEPADVMRGLAALDADPAVGVVQGRKASREPYASRLARFIAAERRYATLSDHVLFDEAFGAAHFAGSGAILRREVPRSVAGWSPATLTEDIEFSIRILLGSGWRIRYEPAMVVRESDPKDWRQLVRQRSRWARGWSEVSFLHLRALLRARRAVGRQRVAGYAWQLVAGVSAPWAVLLPALGVMVITGAVPQLPAPLAMGLAAVVLPARAIAYAQAALADPLEGPRGRWRRAAEAAVMAYGWMPFGWAVQLHALYLETSSAPRTWLGTAKQALPAASPARPA